MTVKSPPWAAIDLKAWHHDAIDLSGEAEGLLVRIVATQWLHGPLPRDREKCHRRLGKPFSDKAWDEIQPLLKPSMYGSTGDDFAVEWVETMRKDAITRMTQKREAGRKGGKRSAKARSDLAKTHHPKHNSSTASSTA